jgi:GH25 family lysozyme M1 (1,4-beta-N-acetylmuramidase)
MVVDIYHDDVVTDLGATAAAGIAGVIHKATQGATITDDKYAARRSQARAAGLLWGAYHFGDNSPVADQVTHFLEIARPDDGTLLALDFEPHPTESRTMRLDQAREFLRLVQERTGRRAILYSGHLIKETLGHAVDPFFAAHRLWLCQYAQMPKLPASWDKFWLWQYTGDGEGPAPHGIPGIQGNIDLNVYMGTAEQLAAEWAGGPAGPALVASATGPVSATAAQPGTGAA